MSDRLNIGARIGVGRTAEVFALDDDRAIKLFYPDFDIEGAGIEARACELATKAGLPVPKFYELVEIDGRAGIITERLYGESMLSRVLRRPYEISNLTQQFSDLHLRLHRCELPALGSYRDYLSVRIAGAVALSDVEKARLLDYLKQLPSDPQMVCHGDFHPDNIMLTKDGPLIIDWVTANAGAPAADVARTFLLLTIGTPAESNPMARLLVAAARSFVARTYRRRYLQRSLIEPAEIDAWRPVIAAARLAENVDGEQALLLPMTQLSQKQ